MEGERGSVKFESMRSGSGLARFVLEACGFSVH